MIKKALLSFVLGSLGSALAAAQTGSAAPAVGSVAPAACAGCHTEALSQPGTKMAQALEVPDKSKVLTDHPVIRATLGRYSYKIERKPLATEYTVTDGAKTVAMNLRWAMGASSADGQTYILEKDGSFYESRVSWFKELNGLGPTLGSQDSMPADIDQAAGRLISKDEELRCFGCHATNAVEGKHLTVDKMTPGVQCGHCHEGTEAHLAAIRSGDMAHAIPEKLSRLMGLPAEEAANFCGQCHRTWAEIAAQENTGIGNVRFQPYRLMSSKCFDSDEPRISCLACHNPHHDAAPGTVNYDLKCKACHGGTESIAANPKARLCPVSKVNCVSCHMPKLELPGAHKRFTDHLIRVVKPNEPYPG